MEQRAGRGSGTPAQVGQETDVWAGEAGSVTGAGAIRSLITAEVVTMKTALAAPNVRENRYRFTRDFDDAETVARSSHKKQLHYTELDTRARGGSNFPERSAG